MGSNYPEPHGPRGHVLVLFPVRARHQDLVEEVHHNAANHPIRDRSRLRVLRVIHVL